MDEKNTSARPSSGPHEAGPSGPDATAQPIQPIDELRYREVYRYDWWRCLRRGAVSGRYEGEMTAPNAGRKVLDLRVDIDPRYTNSPVMSRISGDLYHVYSFSYFGRTYTWRVFQESWIVDAPRVSWSSCRVEIEGTVRYWKGSHGQTTVQVVIPWSYLAAAGPAQVSFTEASGGGESYNCTRKSDCFRDVTLEVDVCDSVNAGTILPSYDTDAHNTRPSDLPQRVLTIEEAYREAGICVTVNPQRTIIDDSAAKFTSWSVSELHDAMETYFGQFSGAWPKWHLWGLFAGRYVNAGTGGIMFDYSGANKPPERQGFAVFRNHSWFNNLPSGTPASQAQAAALRKLLYVWVHEAGHAFNFLHSWDKSRPDSLSWMNYDWRYDNRNGADSFWSDFEMRFDDEELIHMRHGERDSVIMGGDAWASGGHTESPPGAMARLEGEAPVELLVRSRGYFEFMEPVTLELRLRNKDALLPLPIDARLNPEFGTVAIYIRRPDGRIVHYHPVLCQLADAETKVLEPADTGAKTGADRHSEEVFVAAGRDGFYFDAPGEYRVRAVYQGPGDVLIPSEIHRLSVGTPQSRDEERIAQDYFAGDVGLSLYMGGSHSQHLSAAMDVLNSVRERLAGSSVDAKVSAALATYLSQPFFTIVNEKLKQVQDADPQQALDLTKSAVDLYKKSKDKALNLPYSQLMRNRAELMTRLGEKTQAKKELGALRKTLTERGVKKTVTDAIKSFETKLK